MSVSLIEQWALVRVDSKSAALWGRQIQADTTMEEIDVLVNCPALGFPTRCNPPFIKILPSPLCSSALGHLPPPPNFQGHN
eukprot:1156138-Pelagomonas_calceolata.AAC.10